MTFSEDLLCRHNSPAPRSTPSSPKTSISGCTPRDSWRSSDSGAWRIWTTRNISWQRPIGWPVTVMSRRCRSCRDCSVIRTPWCVPMPPAPWPGSIPLWVWRFWKRFWKKTTARSARMSSKDSVPSSCRKWPGSCPRPFCPSIAMPTLPTLTRPTTGPATCAGR